MLRRSRALALLPANQGDRKRLGRVRKHTLGDRNGRRYGEVRAVQTTRSVGLNEEPVRTRQKVVVPNRVTEKAARAELWITNRTAELIVVDVVAVPILEIGVHGGESRLSAGLRESAVRQPPAHRHPAHRPGQAIAR